MNIICFNCGFVQKPGVRLIDRCLECGSSDLIEGDGQELDLSGVTNQLLIDKDSLSEENKSLKIIINGLEIKIKILKGLLIDFGLGQEIKKALKDFEDETN